MPEPFNYTFQQAVQPDFAGSFAKGQAMAEAERQKKAQEEAQLQMQADATEVHRNPTVFNIAGMIAKHPNMGQQYESLLKNASAQQRQNLISQASDVHMALGAGKRDMAIQMLDQFATANRNAGDEREAQSAETFRDLIQSAETGEAGDKAVFEAMGVFLAKALGPEKYKEMYGTFFENKRAEAEAPSKLKESEAKAQKAAVEAKFAESQAAADLQKSGWDITKIQNDIQISKQNAKIAMMNASIARESNDLKRQELGLKLQDEQMKRDERVREKQAEAETALSTIDSSRGLLGELLSPENASALSKATGTTSWTAAIPATEAKTIKGKIEQLQNTLAAANLDKLKGPMSDKDILFLKNIVSNLDRSQSTENFTKELKKVQSILEKNRSIVMKKYGMPETGQPSPVEAEQKTITVDF